MMPGLQEKRMRLRGSFDSLGLAALVGAPVCHAVAGDCDAAHFERLTDFRSAQGPSGQYELSMLVSANQSRMLVSSFEMLYGNQVATFLDLSLPVSLSQNYVLAANGSTARAILTPFEAVGTESFAAPPVEFTYMLGTLSGAVHVDWPDGDDTYLQRHSDYSIGFSLQVDGRCALNGMVLPGGYDVDLELQRSELPENGVMALLGCTLGALALYSRRTQ